MKNNFILAMTAQKRLKKKKKKRDDNYIYNPPQVSCKLLRTSQALSGDAYLLPFCYSRCGKVRFRVDGNVSSNDRYHTELEKHNTRQQSLSSNQ